MLTIENILLLLQKNTPMRKKEKKKEVFQPDDKFFKTVMEDKINARAYLENFYPELSMQLHLETLTLDKESFLTEDLKLFKSDIIYVSKFKGSKEQVNLVLLWENKSQPEKHVAIQLGLYLFLAMYKMIKTKGRKLEPIIPLLFYNGEKKWEPQSVDQLFTKHPFYETIKPFLPNFGFLFKNITDAPTEELLKIETAFFRSAMVAMANKHQALLIFRSYDVIFELDTDYQLNFLFSYLCQVMDRTTKEMRKDLEDIEFINKNKFMSTLEMFKMEGRVERKEIGEGLTSLKGLFRLLKGLPDTSIQKIANLASLPVALVNEIKNTSTAKDKEKMLQIIHDGFFKDLALSQDDKDEVESLITSFLN